MYGSTTPSHDVDLDTGGLSARHEPPKNVACGSFEELTLVSGTRDGGRIWHHYVPVGAIGGAGAETTRDWPPQNGNNLTDARLIVSCGRRSGEKGGFDVIVQISITRGRCRRIRRCSFSSCSLLVSSFAFGEGKGEAEGGANTPRSGGGTPTAIGATEGVDVLAEATTDETGGRGQDLET